MLFEIHLAPGVDPSCLLPDALTGDGKIRVMTPAEARAAFPRLPGPSGEHTICYVAAAGRDAKFVHHVLENNVNVVRMRSFETE